MKPAILQALAGNVDYFQSVELDVLRKSSDRLDYSVLAVAADNGHLRCCQVIFERCPELLYRRSKPLNVSVLHCAAYHGNLEIVKFFLNCDKAIDSSLLMMVRGGGKTALHEAVKQGQNRTAKFLLEEDKDNKLLEMKNYEGNTVMHMAVKNENLELVKLFVEKDNKLLGMINNDGNTVMHIAVENENLDLVKLFVEKDNQIVYSPNKSGAVPLTLALSNAIEGDKTAIAIRKLMIKKQPRRCLLDLVVCCMLDEDWVERFWRRR